MRFQQYDHISGKIIGSLTSLDFGEVVQGQHCVRPVVLRAFADTTESDASNLTIYLTGKGSWTNAAFGYHVDGTFIQPPIEAGSSLMSNHFQADASSVSVPFDGTTSSWVWLDVQCPADQTGVGMFSFRAIYQA